MKTCNSCHNSNVPDDSIFCPFCGGNNFSSLNYGGNVTFNGGNSTSNIGTSSNGYGSVNSQGPARGSGYNNRQGPYYRPTMSEEEEEVKTYRVAEVRSPRTTGFLTVTTKRVIFYAASGESMIDKEVAIDKVTGVDMLRGRNIKWGAVLTAIVLFFAAIYILQEGLGSAPMMIIGALMLLLALVAVFLASKKTYSLAIFCSGCEKSPINIGMGATGLAGNMAITAVVADPTQETFTMIREIGALILDVQTLGEHAVAKWKK